MKIEYLIPIIFIMLFIFTFAIYLMRVKK